MINPVSKQSPSPTAAAQPAKPTLETLVGEWAATVLPQLAPDPKRMGPLAWVRIVKAPELVAKLKAAGYK